MLPNCLAALLMASTAPTLLSIKFWTLCSAAKLVTVGLLSGTRVVSYPRRISLGDKPVVVFFLLLCTADAIVNQEVQPSGDADVTRRRYCSTHWFFRSDSPSVWGWKAEDKFCSIPNFLVRALPKWDVNLGSRSLIIF